MTPAAFKDEIWSLMRDITDGLNGVFHPIAGRHGLTMMQLRVLAELRQEEGRTVGSLSRRVCTAGTNVSALCKQLERAGLLLRARDPRDERVVRLALTEAGRRTADEIDRQLLEALPPPDGEDLDVILGGLRRLQEILQQPPPREDE